VGSNPTSGTIVLVRMADAMRRVLRTIGLASLLSALALPALAGCPDGLREFSGAISAVNAHKLFVESRLEDDIGFERAPETRVTGKKTSWEALATGDEVAICWRFEDRPRKALTITVR
jgi:hypothetical protein